MTELIEVNVATLTGLALDYAVGIADGRELELPKSVRGRTGIVWCDPFVVKRDGYPDFHDKTRRAWSPSTDYSQGGPLIEEHIECLESFAGATEWSAACFGSEDPLPVLHRQTGETPLIAACRAIVAAKLGDTVQVPKELI